MSGRNAAWPFLVGLALATPAPGASTDIPGWTDVSRIFDERCVNCHSALGASAGLRLDNATAAMAGSRNGPVLLPGDASKSELVRRLRGESLPRMPFLSVPLPPEELDLIIRWIDAGLPGTEPVQ